MTEANVTEFRTFSQAPLLVVTLLHNLIYSFHRFPDVRVKTSRQNNSFDGLLAITIVHQSEGKIMGCLCYCVDSRQHIKKNSVKTFSYNMNVILGSIKREGSAGFGSRETIRVTNPECN